MELRIYGGNNAPQGGLDAAFTESIMTQCRTAVGARCLFDNHALGAPPFAADQPVCDTMVAKGGLIYFQTQSPVAMECICPETIT